jgi:hypothetical protein
VVYVHDPQWFSGQKKTKMGKNSGPMGGNRPNGHSVENVFSAQSREFFSPIIYYYQKKVLLPSGNQNSCLNYLPSMGPVTK